MWVAELWLAQQSFLKKKSYAKESVTHVGCYCPQMGKPFIG